MTYPIEWTQIAEGQLAAAWLAAADRTAVTATTGLIEQHLQTRPLKFGLPHRSWVERVAAVPPLTAWFEVIEDDKRVVVQAVALNS